MKVKRAHNIHTNFMTTVFFWRISAPSAAFVIC